MTAASGGADRAPACYLASCPSRKLLDRLSDKWVALVLKSLADGPKRYSEVARQLAVGRAAHARGRAGARRPGREAAIGAGAPSA